MFSKMLRCALGILLLHYARGMMDDSELRFDVLLTNRDLPPRHPSHLTEISEEDFHREFKDSPVIAVCMAKRK